ncbi:Phosphoinositide 3-kinase regulatory subunit 4 [Trichoplax sp. H2]|nr:Phosphoinositide 3-kinase regulatory subunit 4 [Trichoplax sp. H2]|eukprot:RDD40341.1 Phosphoinositide 3-kinase regulatory subunit 4 [Trichoplax sp. H2]
MGNQLSSLAPSQILSVDHYLSDLPQYHYEKRGGLTVVKVFALPDAQLPMKFFQDKVHETRGKLNGCASLLPFQRTMISDRAAFLIRQYMKYTLYDRISTRPFLSDIEKKWIAFQLLTAVKQMHSRNIQHGDIKTENVMVTSWNWVMLTDFACYKPVYLPEDNPADFSYFFDTSRRRSCYIACERFLDSTLFARLAENSQSAGTEAASKANTVTETMDYNKLTAAMDIFSVGCVLAELFTEGHQLFDLSQLLAYRQGECLPEDVLSKIDDRSIQELILHMIQKDPMKRHSAEEYLNKWRGHSFPDVFYDFLYYYMESYGQRPFLTSDEKIAKLKEDMNRIIKELTSTDNYINEFLVLILPLLTSCIRDLQYLNSKLNAIEMIQLLAQYVSDEVVLDRLVPYLVELLTDSQPRAKAAAIRTLTKCLSNVKYVPKSDVNIFLEYILHSLATNDKDVFVRVAYAENIAKLAETALRFLEVSHMKQYSDESIFVKDSTLNFQTSYDIELQALQDLIQKKTVLLLSDTENVVKRAILENGISKLCLFFGRQKASDVLLSHMITFLNDKSDWQMRGTFYDSIIGVAGYVGWQSLSMLRPLLQQGLSDPEEFVICKALEALTDVVNLRLLDGNVVDDVTKEVIPFLYHPVILLSLLKAPLNRPVYDYVIKLATINSIIESLEKRKGDPNRIANYDGDTMQSMFRKLVSLGFKVEDEEKLLCMKEILLRIHHAKSSMDTSHTSEYGSPEHLELIALTKTKSRSLNLSPAVEISNEDSKKSSRRKSSADVGNSNTMNAEWKHMFGSTQKIDHLPSKKNSSKSLLSNLPSEQIKSSSDRKGSISEKQSQLRSAKNSTSSLAADRGLQKYGTKKGINTCKAEVSQLFMKKIERHALGLKAKQVGIVDWEKVPTPAGWKPKGELIAHIREHRGAITKIATSEDSKLFASGSSDGTVKLWEAKRMEGRTTMLKANVTYAFQGSRVTSVEFCQQSSALACATDNGVLRIVRLGEGSTQPTVTNTITLDPKEGSIIDLQYFDSGSQAVLSYVTTHGCICGWDSRMPHRMAWKLQNDLKNGLSTAYTIDRLQCWLAVGSSTGAHVCACVKCLTPNPKEQSWVVSSMQGNNEVSMWDVETGARRKMLWASSAPPMSTTQSSPESVLAVYPGPPDDRFILTAGTDRRIRYWDTESCGSSYVVVGSATETTDSSEFQYRSRAIDGTEVIIEKEIKRKENTQEDAPRRGPEAPFIGHHDTINQLTVVKGLQGLMISGAQDGVIKVWV